MLEQSTQNASVPIPQSPCDADVREAARVKKGTD